MVTREQLQEHLEQGITEAISAGHSSDPYMKAMTDLGQWDGVGDLPASVAALYPYPREGSGPPAETPEGSSVVPAVTLGDPVGSDAPLPSEEAISVSKPGPDAPDSARVIDAAEVRGERALGADAATGSEPGGVVGETTQVGSPAPADFDFARLSDAQSRDPLRERRAGHEFRSPRDRWYCLRKRLGAGRYAEVWLAEANPPFETTDDQTGDVVHVTEVAVKILNDGMDSKATHQFWDEIPTISAMRQYEHTHRLRAADGQSHLPQVFDQSQVGVLQYFVLTLAKGERLDETLRRDPGLVDEHTALEIVAQYARVLQCLHHGAKRTLLDFQPGNLWWQPEDQHLLVIDWNLLDEGQFQRDLNQTLALLYRMVMGVPLPVGGSSRFLGNPPERWQVLSYGLRQLLQYELALASNPTIMTAAALQERLEALLVAWRADPYALMEDAEDAAAGLPVDRAEKLSDDQQAALLRAAHDASVARAKAREDQVLQARFARLDGRISETLSGTAEVNIGRNFFGVPDYEAAERALQRAVRSAWNFEGALLAARWLAGIQGSQERLSRNLQVDRETLERDVLARLEAGTLPDFQKASEVLRAWSVNPETPGYGALLAEAELHLARAEGDALIARHIPVGAAEAYTRAANRSRACVYLAGLRKGLAEELDALAAGAAETARRQEIQGGIIQTIQSAASPHPQIGLLRAALDATPQDTALGDLTVALARKALGSGQWRTAEALAKLGLDYQPANRSALGEVLAASQNVPGLLLAGQMAEARADIGALKTALDQLVSQPSGPADDIARKLRADFLRERADAFLRSGDGFALQRLHEAAGDNDADAPKRRDRILELQTRLRDKLSRANPPNLDASMLLAELTQHPDDEYLKSLAWEHARNLFSAGQYEACRDFVTQVPAPSPKLLNLSKLARALPGLPTESAPNLESWKALTGAAIGEPAVKTKLTGEISNRVLRALGERKFALADRWARLLVDDVPKRDEFLRRIQDDQKIWRVKQAEALRVAEDLRKRLDKILREVTEGKEVPASAIKLPAELKAWKDGAAQCLNSLPPDDSHKYEQRAISDWTVVTSDLDQKRDQLNLALKRDDAVFRQALNVVDGNKVVRFATDKGGKLALQYAEGITREQRREALAGLSGALIYLQSHEPIPEKRQSYADQAVVVNRALGQSQLSGSVKGARPASLLAAIAGGLGLLLLGGGGGYLAGTSLAPTAVAVATPRPPTLAAPTLMPPTAVLPTAAPPTIVPPTAVPPTAVPPTPKPAATVPPFKIGFPVSPTNFAVFPYQVMARSPFTLANDVAAAQPYYTLTLSLAKPLTTPVTLTLGAKSLPFSNTLVLSASVRASKEGNEWVLRWTRGLNDLSQLPDAVYGLTFVGQGYVVSIPLTLTASSGISATVVNTVNRDTKDVPEYSVPGVATKTTDQRARLSISEEVRVLGRVRFVEPDGAISLIPSEIGTPIGGRLNSIWCLYRGRQGFGWFFCQFLADEVKGETLPLLAPDLPSDLYATAGRSKP